MTPGSDAITHCPQPSCLRPAEQFYWALIDASQIGSVRRRHAHRQLGYLFENVLPVPIEDIQAVYLRLAEGRYIACGMEKQSLRSQNNGQLHLGPDRIPSHIRETVEPERINLLTGEFEPEVIRRMKARRLLHMAAILAITSALALIGVHRRTAAFDNQIVALCDARQEIFDVVGINTATASGGQPPELRLIAELRRLRQTRQAPASEVELTDVTPLLASLLARWPVDVNLQTESMLVTPAAITIRGVVPESGSAQAMATSLSSSVERESNHLAQGHERFPGGWTMVQPHVTNVRDGVQIVLQMHGNDKEHQR